MVMEKLNLEVLGLGLFSFRDRGPRLLIAVFR